MCACACVLFGLETGLYRITCALSQITWHGSESYSISSLLFPARRVLELLSGNRARISDASASKYAPLRSALLLCLRVRAMRSLCAAAPPPSRSCAARRASCVSCRAGRGSRRRRRRVGERFLSLSPFPSPFSFPFSSMLCYPIKSDFLCFLLVFEIYSYSYYS